MWYLHIHFVWANELLLLAILKSPFLSLIVASTPLLLSRRFYPKFTRFHFIKIFPLPYCIVEIISFKRNKMFRINHFLVNHKSLLNKRCLFYPHCRCHNRQHSVCIIFTIHCNDIIHVTVFPRHVLHAVFKILPFLSKCIPNIFFSH